jgi:hypothetical protein
MIIIAAAGGTASQGQLLVGHSMYGINTHVPADAVLAKLESAGIAWARIDINWVQVQPNGPNDYNWGFLDTLVNAADARGIRLFATLGYTPGWANGNQGINKLPIDFNHWKNFVRATVNRYKGSIHHWGLWNEPNLGQFLDEFVTDYVNRALIPGAQAIREADPTAMRIGPEVSSNGTYFETVLNMAADHLDIITVHMYGETVAGIMQEFDGPSVGDSYQQILIDTGVFGTKPVWYTEVGWPTDDGTHVGTVTEAEQAANYVALLDAVRQRPWIEKVFFYEIADDPTPTVPEWGILEAYPGLAEKQGYGAYRDYITANPPAVIPTTEVWIDLGMPDTADGMTHPQSADGATAPAAIAGKTARRNDDPITPPADNYFYFAVDDAYAFEGDYAEHYIIVGYLDAGTGSLTLHYDSSDPAPFPNDRYKNGGSVALTDSGTWRQHAYHVTDAYFGNRQNAGADFRIHKTNGGEFHLDRIQVTRPPASDPPTAVIQADPTHGADPLNVTFDATDAYDLDGTIVAYAWDFDDDGIVDSTNVVDSHVYTGITSATASLTVTDNDGLTDTAAITVWPGCTVAISNSSRYATATFSTGSTYHADQPYIITSLPPILEGAAGVLTADADANQTDDTWLTFDLSETAEVFVAYDADANSIPGWLVNFVDTGEVIGLSDPGQPRAKLYRRIYTNRKVALGGNLASGASGAAGNYFVLVRPNCTIPSTFGVPALRVDFTEPAPGITVDVPPTRVVARFDSRVEKSTLDASTVRVIGSGGDGIFGNGNDIDIVATSFSGGAKAVVFNPTGGFLPDDVYQFRLADTIHDAYDLMLDGEYLGSLPSGDGWVGGEFVCTFVVRTSGVPASSALGRAAMLLLLVVSGIVLISRRRRGAA